MRLAHDAIVMVLDGSRMLLMRNRGDPVYPDLEVIAHQQFENLPNRELRSDAPGLSYSSNYPGRNTVARGDPHHANEQRFAAAALDVLAGSLGNEGEGIVIVAPPETLGELRQHYPRAVAERIVAEIAKDLTKHPVEEITRLISEYGEQQGA